MNRMRGAWPFSGNYIGVGLDVIRPQTATITAPPADNSSARVTAQAAVSREASMISTYLPVVSTVNIAQAQLTASRYESVQTQQQAADSSLRTELSRMNTSTDRATSGTVDPSRDSRAYSEPSTRPTLLQSESSAEQPVRDIQTQNDSAIRYEQDTQDQPVRNTQDIYNSGEQPASDPYVPIKPATATTRPPSGTRYEPLPQPQPTTQLPPANYKVSSQQDSDLDKLFNPQGYDQTVLSQLKQTAQPAASSNAVAIGVGVGVGVLALFLLMK